MSEPAKEYQCPICDQPKTQEEMAFSIRPMPHLGQGVGEQWPIMCKECKDILRNYIDQQKLNAKTF